DHRRLRDPLDEVGRWRPVAPVGGAHRVHHVNRRTHRLRVCPRDEGAADRAAAGGPMSVRALFEAMLRLTGVWALLVALQWTTGLFSSVVAAPGGFEVRSLA